MKRIDRLPIDDRHALALILLRYTDDGSEFAGTIAINEIEALYEGKLGQVRAEVLQKIVNLDWRSPYKEGTEISDGWDTAVKTLRIRLGWLKSGTMPDKEGK